MSDLIEELSEIIETEETLTSDTLLEAIPEYDSMAVLMLLNWLDTKGVNTTPADVEKFRTVGDILALVKG